MTTDEFIAKQNARIEAIIRENVPLRLAVNSITSLISNRVWLKGLNSDGAIIGTYSKDPVYISGKLSEKTRLPKFPLKGKTGKSKFKNGNEHKSGYFDSYYAFKKKIGRNNKISTVDLFLTGDLHKDWANGNEARPEPTRVNQNEYYQAIDEDNSKKVLRYGRVFQPTKDEKDKFFAIIQSELGKAMRS